MIKSNDKRIEWVDIAKGIAIILMVVGHEIPTGDIWYRLIFSFHMPLFFILSGFTSGEIVSCEKLIEKLKRSFKKVWLLAVIIVFTYCLECLLFQSSFTLATFVKQFTLGVFWGCNKIPITNVTGTMWFMFAFFWSKFLYDILRLWLPNKYNGIILLILSLISFLIHRWLPQVLDLSTYGALFMWLGWFMKNNLSEWNEKTKEIRSISIVLILIYWLALTIGGIYVDMSIRFFPLFVVSILEAFCGTIIVCKLSSIIQNQKVIKWFKTFGKYSLQMLCIHQLDLYWVFWAKYISHWYLALTIRLIIDVVIFLAYLYFYRYFYTNKLKG
ncbi:acyltransferase family protein [Limosilactobacillus coleohominis]|uniref:acyltransferase family protein n=1 Tax=Limosilactobacillus coleohominis TaxID=181675 RepID=UPI00195CC504|nr:acyltransferase family protein [Limosilactobacillus coleohominis]MBM6955334.1 acyltransferase family protein [Limosilactobacillus coleohominis]